MLERLAVTERITRQRRQVVEMVTGRSKSFSAEDILAELRQRKTAVGRATAFRTLNLLVRLGYLSKLREGERQRYVVCTPNHHCHLVCSSCGQILHIPGCPVGRYLTELELATGYHVAEHRLEIAGLCPNCRTKDPTGREVGGEYGADAARPPR